MNRIRLLLLPFIVGAFLVTAPASTAFQYEGNLLDGASQTTDELGNTVYCLADAVAAALNEEEDDPDNETGEDDGLGTEAGDCLTYSIVVPASLPGAPTYWKCERVDGKKLCVGFNVENCLFWLSHGWGGCFVPDPQ